MGVSLEESPVFRHGVDVNPIYFSTHNPDSLFGTTSVDNRYRFDLFIDEEQNYILKTKYQGIDIVGNVNSSTLWYPR